jgi:hypothetical protein
MALVIAPNTVLKYTCKFTNETITETFCKEIDGDYLMESCACYGEDEVLSMEVVEGSVEKVIEVEVKTEFQKKIEKLGQISLTYFYSKKDEDRDKSEKAKEELFKLGYVMCCGYPKYVKNIPHYAKFFK